MANTDCKFRKALISEFTCAMNAVFGDVADENDEIMKKNPDIRLDQVMAEGDLMSIMRKMNFYIFQCNEPVKVEFDREKMLKNK